MWNGLIGKAGTDGDAISLPSLTHTNKQGKATMVNVANKVIWNQNVNLSIKVSLNVNMNFNC